MQKFLNKKVSPCIQSMAIDFVKSLHSLEKSSAEGKLAFTDKFTWLASKSTEWQKIYEGDAGDSPFEFIKNLAPKSCEVASIVEDFINSLDNPPKALKICQELTSQLPDGEIKEHSLNDLETLSNIDFSKITTNEFTDSNIDFFAITFPLVIHCLLNKLDEVEISEEANNDDFYKDKNIFEPIIGVMYESLAQLSHQQGMADLIYKIKGENDEALFKAVTIDKSLMFEDEIKERILNAQLTGDEQFFKKLAKAIGSNPLSRLGQHGDTYAVVRMFWYFGLCKLSQKELYDFLVFCGLNPPEYPVAFKKFMQRHIHPLFKT